MRGILDRTVKRAATFLFLKKGLWITRVPLWIVYEVGNSVQCPKHIRSGLVSAPVDFVNPVMRTADLSHALEGAWKSE